MSSPAGQITPGSALPTLPIIVARLVALYSTDDYTIDQVVRLIESDPPVSSRLLRLANSAYYGFEGRVESTRRASLLLGSATVQGVALGASLLRPWSDGKVPAEIEQIWIDSFLCGVGCRYLIRRLPRDSRTGDPDSLFLTGLFHNVGKILFLAADAIRYAEVLRRAKAGEELRSAEREMFGRDHAEAGGELLEAWGLPGRISSLVRHHHTGGLRAELRSDWEVLASARGALSGKNEEDRAELPPDLVADLMAHLQSARPEAETFYRSVL